MIAEDDQLKETLFPRTLGLIIVFATVVRLSAVFLIHSNGYYLTDERQYVHMAQRILDGQGFMSENGERSTIAPLYVFSLASVFSIFGNSLVVPHVIGCLLGIIIVILGYAISLELFQTERVALLTAGVCAIYPSLVIYSGLLVTETLYIVLFQLALLVSLKMIKTMTVGMGVFLGIVAALATLTRAVFFGFFPILLTVVWWMRKEQLRHGAKPLILALLVWSCVLLPWTIRNYNVHHAFVPVSTGGGKVLLAGNNPFAPKSFRAVGFDEWLKHQALERGVGDLNALPELELFSVYKSIALDFMVSHPFETLRLAAQKMHIFWVYPIAHSDSNIPVQMFVTGADVLLYLGAAIGLAACWQDRKRLTPLFAAIGFFCVVQVVLHSEARFRLPIVPFLCILCGYAIFVLTERGRRKEFMMLRSRMIGLAVGIGSIILIYGYTGVLFLTGIVS
jgi:hypothetical protein